MNDFTNGIDMSPPAVAKRVVEDWLDGTDQYEWELLEFIILYLADRLGNTAEIVYGDGHVSKLAAVFREAADTMEMEFGERVGHGERLMQKIQERRRRAA